MAEGHGEDAWGRASALLCLLANVHRDHRRRAYEQSDFNPFARPKQAPRLKGKEAVATLAEAFGIKRKKVKP